MLWLMPSLCAFVLLLVALSSLPRRAESMLVRRSKGSLEASRPEQGHGHWYGSEAKEVIRELLAAELEHAQSERTKSAAASRSPFRKISSLFSERDKFGTGQKHNCFFTAVNCRFGPQKNRQQGVIRLRIDDNTHRRIVAKHGHKRRRKIVL